MRVERGERTGFFIVTVLSTGKFESKAVQYSVGATNIVEKLSLESLNLSVYRTHSRPQMTDPFSLAFGTHLAFSLFTLALALALASLKKKARVRMSIPRQGLG